MKKQTFAVGTALLFCLVLAVASAHSQGRGVVANIPFAFSVGDKALPAGQYSIMPALSSGAFVQEIRSADGDVAIFLPTMALDARDAKNGRLGPRLVFHVYGHSYFLSEIWTDAGVQGRKLLETSREKELARSETKREVAVLLQPVSAKR